MPNIEIKNFNFEIKATNENTFEGYAAVFRNVDSHGDIIEPGAFAKTIKESKRVKVLWQHDPWQVLGKPLAMEEDNHGLYVKAQISDTTLGRDVMQLMKDKVIDELSIGFNTVKDEWDNEKNARLIKEIRLWEFSPVTFASNAQANITDAKSIDGGLMRLQSWIDGELKAGKVLSSKNQGLVKNAIEALTALLEASEGKNVEPPNSTQNLTEEQQKAANDIKAMLKNMQEFAKKGRA